MDRLQEKTTAPYPPVGADGGQSLSQKPNPSIAEGVAEHKPPERDLEEIMRQISRVNDPAYLPTVSMNDLYEQVYPGRPPVIDGLLYAGTQGGQVLSHGTACLSCEYGPFPVGV